MPVSLLPASDTGPQSEATGAFGVAGHRPALLVWLTSLWLLNFGLWIVRWSPWSYFVGRLDNVDAHEVMKYSFWCFLIASWLIWCPSKHLVQSRTVTGAAVGFTVISGLCLEPTVGVPILRIYSSWHQFPSKLPECFLGLEWHQVGDSWVLGHRLALSYSQQVFQFKFLPLLCLSTTAHPSQWRSCWSSPWLQAAVSACSPNPHHSFLPGWLRSAGSSYRFSSGLLAVETVLTPTPYVPHSELVLN